MSSQNAQFAAGSLGADPAVKGQVFTANVTGDSLFSSLKQFQDIIIVANSNGTTVKLSRRGAYFVRLADVWLRAGL